ncbi:type I DNA topoisomerase [Acinetobacter baumannii]|uniref:type I DNA topoisomerase n=4 Tax=Acinetobacter baumannii TaxID=470 RepID=UPI002341365A|nr:type I DNA topoisomerase [Acinetobacter baumannii]MDC4147476.1 type I DNA topoisomerase [Acinetobacter baumannii]
MTDLMIVESPKKAKTIQSLLKGQNIIVKASVGHVRDLPEKEMGVSAPDYKPTYVYTERGKKVIKELKELAKNAENIFLASDADREGEAIAWHLQDALKLDSYKRVEYKEITKKAITEALNNPRNLDFKLVASQEARRILDRLVGFKVSTAVREGTGLNLPAGRVQSPATKLVVIRENEIRNFKPTPYFTVKANFKDAWSANLDLSSILEKGVTLLTDKSIVNDIEKNVKKLEVIGIEEIEKNVSPPSPLKTSELQQVAFNKFSFSSDKTMKLAQSIYEKGLITYHRTDSVNISDEGFELIQQYAESKNYPIADEKNTWTNKADAQAAHESIRPSDFFADVSELDSDELKIYNLILNRAVASQLKDAIDTVKTITLSDSKYVFKSSTTVNKFLGWRSVYDSSDEDDEEKEPDQKIPLDIKEGDLFLVDKDFNIKTESKKTKAPPRYNEATLIKALERMGIGRPSTYASIMQRIFAHGYLEEKAEGRSKKKYLYATEKAFQLFECLETNFNFYDFNYTKELEEKLDKIAQGKAKYREVLTELDNDLDKSISNTTFKMLKPQYDFDCSCGAKLKRHYNKSKKQFWWGCSNYPECKNTYFDKDESPDYDSVKSGNN